MSIITPIKRYLPHELHTRIHAVKLYRSEHDISFVCRRYKVSKSSLLRWNKRYDGTPGSLMDRSHRPHTPHPNSHTPEEIKWVRNLVRRTPDISCPELWWKLHRKKGYHRRPGCLLCQSGRAEILPIYDDRRGCAQALHLPLHGAEQCLHLRFHQKGHPFLQVRSCIHPDRQ